MAQQRGGTSSWRTLVAAPIGLALVLSGILGGTAAYSPAATAVASGDVAAGGAGSICATGSAPGVTATQISVASTVVTSGVGAGFLGQAQDGMKAAIDQVNAAGGVCGRTIDLHTVNSGWDYQNGGSDITSFIDSGDYFALVGEPDSEGLANSIDSGAIDAAGIPVVGTGGMLADQYNDPWVWPVAASTVTNMHLIAQYAVQSLGVTSASQVGVIYDTSYRFGPEGATALNNEIQRLTGSDIPGFGAAIGCTSQFCAINSESQDYTSQVNTFDSACADKCAVVVTLLEPSSMETWMNAEESSGATWFTRALFGGEPLFDDNVANSCAGCGQAPMRVWTGYDAPVEAQSSAQQYCNALHAVSATDDCNNQFTEGAYIGTELFIQAVEDVASADEALTRANLQKVLDSQTFDLGLTSAPLHYGSSACHLANSAMAEFEENYSGSFNGWESLGTGFLADSDPTADLCPTGPGNPASTATTLASDPSPSTYGQAVTFTATVSPTDGGLVDFTSDGTPIPGCTGQGLVSVDANYEATCTTSWLHPGQDSIRADYRGDSAYLGSYGASIQTVDPAPTTLTASPAVLALGGTSLSPFTLSATLTRSDDGAAVAGQTVTFMAADSPLCHAVTDGDGVASCDLVGSKNTAAIVAVAEAGGYSAHFAATDYYLGSSAQAGIIG